MGNPNIDPLKNFNSILEKEKDFFRAFQEFNKMFRNLTEKNLNYITIGKLMKRFYLENKSIISSSLSLKKITKILMDLFRDIKIKNQYIKSEITLRGYR